MTIITSTSICVGDACGWIAALVALFAAGTYGVPIKETMYQITDLNPFVFQTYKVVIFFVVSVITVVSFQIPIRMTYLYGTLSGFLWVCGGTGGIVAVRYAGIATAVGTWASIMICINFSWGILVFHEPVVNLYNTATAFLLLALGLVGMSIYGDPGSSKSAYKSTLPSTGNMNTVLPLSDHQDCNKGSKDIESTAYKKANDLRLIPNRKNTVSFTSAIANRHHRSFNNNSTSSDEEYELEESSENTITNTLLKQRKVKDSCNDEEITESDSVGSTSSTAASTMSCGNSANSNATPMMNYNPETHVRLFNCHIIVTKRMAGFLAALFNGFMSGSSLIPMHYAKRLPNGNWGGLNYLISFSVGSLFSCIGIWIIYFVILMVRQYQINQKTATTSSSLSSSGSNSGNPNLAVIIAGNASSNTEDVSVPSRNIHQNLFQQAASKMPDAYFKVLWKSGLAAGLLNAIAMVGSVLAVTYLGQGVGNSVIQCKIIVSGMWGIYYYKEIDNPMAIRKWFISASLSVIGIVWLSRERIKATAQA